jgi:ribosomal protein S18 acetylase RimI-like enzyme
MKARIKNTVSSLFRSFAALRRPSKEENMRQLNRQGYMPDDFTIRKATIDDIKLLAELHVQTWNETYWNVKPKPTFKTREAQWSEQFKDTTSNWFCFVVINPDKQLIGFAKGQKYVYADLQNYAGELNKLYLLAQYQRLGLGRKLICKVARQFIDMGITSMVLFGDAKNPSCHFHDVMEGERLYAANGEFHGGYGWKDLTLITNVCD